MMNSRILSLGLLVTLFCFASTLHAAKAIRGDANGDGKLSLSDLATMIRLLGSGKSSVTLLKVTPALDVDKDDSFSKTDVTALLQVLLGKAQAETFTVSGGFCDDDQTNPGGSGSTTGGFTDDDQSSPSTEGGGGGFKDDDMSDPG